MLPNEISQFLDQLQDLVFSIVLTPSPMAIFANAALARHAGLPLSEFINQAGALEKLVHPDDWAGFLRLAGADVPQSGSFRLLAKNKQWFAVEANFSKTKVAGLGHDVVQVLMRPNQPMATQPQQDAALDQVAEIGRYLGEVSDPAAVCQRLGESIQTLCPKAAALLLGQFKQGNAGYTLEYARVGMQAVDHSEWSAGDHPDPDFLQELLFTKESRIYATIDDEASLAEMLAGMDFLAPFNSGNVAAAAVPMLAGESVAGWVLALSPGDGVFQDLDISMVSAIANMAGSLIKTVSNHDMLTEAYDKTIEGWGTAVEIRDHESTGHSVRVAEMTVRLAERLGLSGEDLVNIRRGALMHDIGKLGVSDSILLKTGPLDIEEIHEMRKHPQYAYDMLKNIGFMKNAMEIPYSHHERWDGTGYPQKLKGTQIPLAARIFSLVDVYDSMLSTKPYRRAWSINQVIDYIELNAGSMFDPQIAKEFVNMILEENRERRRHMADASSQA